MPLYLFRHDFKVRDYECDLQGVVNNANYLHYMEHTRHLFLEALCDGFFSLHQRGVDLFLRKVTVEYRTALRGGDEFVSLLSCEKSGAKAVFVQDLYSPDGKMITKGIVEAVEVKNGVLTRGEYLSQLIAKAKEHFTPFSFPQ